MSSIWDSVAIREGGLKGAFQHPLQPSHLKDLIKALNVFWTSPVTNGKGYRRDWTT